MTQICTCGGPARQVSHKLRSSNNHAEMSEITTFFDRGNIEISLTSQPQVCRATALALSATLAFSSSSSSDAISVGAAAAATGTFEVFILGPPSLKCVARPAQTCIRPLPPPLPLPPPRRRVVRP